MAVPHNVSVLLLCTGNVVRTVLWTIFLTSPHPVAQIETNDMYLLFAALFFHDHAAHPTDSDTLGGDHGNGWHIVWLSERERNHPIQVDPLPIAC